MLRGSMDAVRFRPDGSRMLTRERHTKVSPLQPPVLRVNERDRCCFNSLSIDSITALHSAGPAMTQRTSYLRLVSNLQRAIRHVIPDERLSRLEAIRLANVLRQSDDERVRELIGGMN
jgi:hypothetical protein